MGALGSWVVVNKYWRDGGDEMALDGFDSLSINLHIRFHGCSNLLRSRKNGTGLSGLHESLRGD